MIIPIKPAHWCLSFQKILYNKNESITIQNDTRSFIMNRQIVAETPSPPTPQSHQQSSVPMLKIPEMNQLQFNAIIWWFKRLSHCIVTKNIRSALIAVDLVLQKIEVTKIFTNESITIQHDIYMRYRDASSVWPSNDNRPVPTHLYLIINESNTIQCGN